ncbi:DUF1573 domain-containing protein [Gemmata sp. G18]|uniref:DUF1573 domain-containing protein n=1 Tax=Gemmata palustris TaxID=2822762 RepID=A0ABS5BU50_9BACT|nr:DUF1573 domain-containing protein [Gemmata palustris]MBP3957254.1 DUF1573 domain-containing protein [Gemmata palustris]
MRLLVTISCILAAISVASFVYWAKGPVRAESVAAPVRRGVHFLEPDKQLGAVRLNETIHDSFTLVNDTDRTIMIGEPMKSCSCTTAELDRRELAPGERCSLKFAINAGGNRVPRRETIALVCTSAGSDAVQVFGRVYFAPKGVFEIDPTEVILTRAKPKATFVVSTASTAEQNKVIDVRSNHQCVHVDAGALPIVTLELDLNTRDEAVLEAECIITTNNPSEETIRVPVRVRK